MPVFVFSDDEHDRMRLMAPIGVVEELDPDLLHVLLQANYDRALDARYAMRNRELWAVVVHPLATLATDDLPSLFDQVCVDLVGTDAVQSRRDLHAVTGARQNRYCGGQSSAVGRSPRTTCSISSS